MSTEDLKTAATEAMQRAQALAALEDAADAAQKADLAAAIKAAEERAKTGVYTPEERAINAARSLYRKAARKAVSIAEQLGVGDTWRTYAGKPEEGTAWHAEWLAAWATPAGR